MKSHIKLPLFSLICTLIFAITLTPATYAVDGCSSTSFNVATNINIGAAPFGIAVADFNTDGHLDIVLSPNNSSSQVVLLLGRGGTEKFGPPTFFAAGGSPVRMASGDFNGDGKADVAVSLADVGGSASGNLSILLNDGTGKFVAPTLISLPGDPILPVVGDLNNDGKLDIAVALSDGTSDGKVGILLGSGTGNFSQAANSPITTLSAVQTPVIGDFNEDGKRDLAILGSLSVGGVDIWLGNGAGGFATGVNFATGIFSFLLLQGDFNNDGHLDLLHGTRLLLGTGTGSFGAPIVAGIPAGGSVGLTGDFNNDNKLDVVSAGTPGLTISLGDGTGNLVRGKSYLSGASTFGASSQFAGLGDFNEDGKLDIAAFQGSGVGILNGDGTGAFNDAPNYHTMVSSASNLVVTDFNIDGKQDFAVSGPFGGSGLEVALGDGTGSFTLKSFTNFFITGVTGIAAADFTGDGKPDLAVTRQLDGKVFFLVNDGAGGFPANDSGVTNVAFGTQVSAIVAGDFNNDNKADVAVVTPLLNRFSILLGNGNNGFIFGPNTSILGPAGGIHQIDTGDFDGDGKLDLAVVRTSGNLVNVFKGDGTGQFSDYAAPATPGGPTSLRVRDLNGDGKSDIAVVSSASETFGAQPYVTVLLNNGAGGFDGTNYATESEGTLAVGDFNNDNKPDLAVNGGFQSNVYVLTNKGTGQFNAPVTIGVAQPSSYLTVGDFNGDTEDDIISSQISQSVAVLLNNFSGSPQPCLSVNDVSVTENDSGTVDATFTVTLSAATAQTVRVNLFALSGGGGFSSNFTPATKDADFADAPGTVTFLPGETTKTFSVPVKGDLIDEPDQLFTLMLTTPVNALISDGRGIGTIVDNDAPATISINDVSVAEGNFNSLSATFTVSLNGPSEKAVTVQYALEPGTATAGSDYFNVSGNVEFPVGTVTRTISVGTIPDNVFEPDETFVVNLSNPTTATIADGQGQGTITNDDPQPTVSVGSAFRTEGAQGTSGDATLSVTLSNPSFQTITVSYATANDTATAGSDYVATSGSVTFNPGEITKSIAVSVTGDNVDEQHETFFVNLSNPTNATIGTAQGQVTIGDDDGPTISINSVSVPEGSPSSNTNATFTVTLSAPSVQSVLVNISTADGSATNGIDYQRVLSRTLFIPAGQTSTTTNIRVFGDFQIEPDETFTATLQFADNATIASGQGTGTATIVNDDSNGKLQFSSATATTSEAAGNLVIQVNRVDGATGTVTVDFATANGTATAGSDYTATSGTLTFNQGEIAKAILVPITNDTVSEVDETFSVKLSNPTGGATLGTPDTALITIGGIAPHLVLEDSALDPNHIAAIDALLFLRDPFVLISPVDLFNMGPDKNTRVLMFATNVQLAQGESASAVTVSLVDSNGQSYDLAAEDVRAIPLSEFVQIKFRLPDNLASGVCNVKIKLHGLESNQGTIRIQ